MGSFFPLMNMRKTIIFFSILTFISCSFLASLPVHATPLTVTVSPTSAYFHIGQSRTFYAYISGGTPPYVIGWWKSVHGSSSYSLVGTDVTLSISFDGTGLYDLKAIVGDDADDVADSNIAVLTVTTLSFSSLNVNPTQCLGGAALTFTGKLYYSGTSTAPPNGNYNVQVLLSGLSVGADTTLVSGSFSISANAPGSAGTYTYTCSASYASAGTFSSVYVGYQLTISTSTGGTTSPSPGTYLKNKNTWQDVTAINSSGYLFDHWLLDGSTLVYANPCSLYMAASHTIQAFFVLETPPPSDTTPPTFGTITANTTGAGLAVTLSCAVSDDVNVSSYKFEWNNTGTPQNQTVVIASGASLTATFSGVWNTSIGNVVGVKVYVNDSSNNWNSSGVTYFLLTDPTGPTFSDLGINTTIAGAVASFSALAADNINMSGYIFQSNITGTVQNTTWVAFSVFFNETAAWINVTETLPGIVDNVVQWQFLFNDSADNWVACDLQNTTLTSPPPATVAQITFYVGGGGLLYVNGGLTGDNVTLNCTIGSTLSFAAVPSSGYEFSAFLWTNGTGLASPSSYDVLADDSVYVYFTASASPGGPSGPGGSSNPPASIQVTITSHVSASPGQGTVFDLTITWQSGIANLTVTSISPGGSFSSWIMVVDVLPKTGGAGRMTVSLKCTPSWDANLGQANIPVSVGVQPVGGSALTVSGSIVVTVVSAQEMGAIPLFLTIVFLAVAVIAGFYRYIPRRH